MAKQQREVDPEYLFFEAPREQVFITGSEAVAEAVKRGNVDMAIAYPITPQSESMHLVGDLYVQGYLKEAICVVGDFAHRGDAPPVFGEHLPTSERRF